LVLLEHEMKALLDLWASVPMEGVPWARELL
jgi:hypothetical protein